MSREKEGDGESSKRGCIIREGFSVLGGGFFFFLFFFMVRFPISV